MDDKPKGITGKSNRKLQIIQLYLVEMREIVIFAVQYCEFAIMKRIMIKERLISGLFGCMFILLFQPFGLIAFGTFRWVLFGGICICVLGSILLAEFIVACLIRMPHEPQRGMKYILKRNVLFQVTNITLMTGNTAIFLDRFCSTERLDNHLSWGNLLYVFIIFLGCSILIGLYWRNVYMKRDFQRQLQEAQYLNGILQERNRIEKQAVESLGPTKVSKDSFSEITLSGTTKESLKLLPEDFIYAEANGNYVQVHYLKDGMAKNIMIRCSISQVEATLSVCSNIMRCHRAFVVNLMQVSRLENHATSLQLYFKETKSSIPVSKTYLQTIKERIVDPH